MLKLVSAVKKMQRLSTFTLLTAFVALASSCDKPQQINAEAVALRAKIEEVQKEEREQEDALQVLMRENSSMKEHVLVRKFGSTLDQKAQILSAEVQALTETREKIQKDIDQLSNIESTYRKKYL